MEVIAAGHPSPSARYSLATGSHYRERGRTFNHVHNVLFVCTGNSARTILAEALLHRLGKKKFHSFSAGSHPTGVVHPMAIELLRSMDFPTADLKSKSWNTFVNHGAAPLDFILTVCDKAAEKTTPNWPGEPMTAYWHIADPVAVAGSEDEKWIAFRETFRLLEHRIKIFTNLPFDSLDRDALQERLDGIGKARPPPARFPMWPHAPR